MSRPLCQRGMIMLGICQTQGMLPSTKCAPLVSLNWALLWGWGQIPTTYQSSWVVMDTGSRLAIRQYPELSPPKQVGLRGPAEICTILPCCSGLGFHQPGTSLPSSTGTSAQAPAKPEQPGSHQLQWDESQKQEEAVGCCGVSQVTNGCQEHSAAR